MPNVTFIEPSGESRTIAIRNGTNLMEGGVLGGVSGIEADCGGARLCGTCQVLVPDEWVDKLPPKIESEEAILELAHEPQPNSRLSCFIRMSDALDGLVLHVPEAQR